MKLDLTLRALFLVVNQMPKPRTFLYDTFFNDRETTDKEEVLIEFKNGRRFVAPFKTVKIAPKKTFSANELTFERMAGENPFATDPEMKKAKAIAETLSEQTEQISRTREMMAAEVLYNLTLTVKGEGISDKIEYFDKQEKEHITNVAVAWDQKNSDPIKDINTLLRKITEEGGTRPSAIILDSKASDLFQNNDKVKEVMNFINFYVGQIKPETENVEGVIYIGTLSSLGLDIYEYQEYYDYVDVDGLTKTKSLVPEYTALLVPKGNKVKFGAESTIKDGLLEGELIPRIFEDEKNDTVEIRTISKPVLIPINTKSIKVLKVK